MVPIENWNTLVMLVMILASSLSISKPSYSTLFVIATEKMVINPKVTKLDNANYHSQINVLFSVTTKLASLPLNNLYQGIEGTSSDGSMLESFCNKIDYSEKRKNMIQRWTYAC